MSGGWLGLVGGKECRKGGAEWAGCWDWGQPRGGECATCWPKNPGDQMGICELVGRWGVVVGWGGGGRGAGMRAGASLAG